MPNWTHNKLTITNSTPKLEEFLKEHGLSFEAIVKPERPENYGDGCSTIAAQTDAWGTKWDLDETEAKETAASLLENDECIFDTAWSPPSEAIRALSELTGASFLLAYYEPGCWFWGVEDISEGFIYPELDGNETQEQLHEFLVQYMDYSTEEATEAVGWDEEDEEEEEEKEEEESKA
jgi:hypothetical protein